MCRTAMSGEGPATQDGIANPLVHPYNMIESNGALYGGEGKTVRTASMAA